jgi:DNA-directed RNA polymerase specialized sigma24 family protein
MKRLTESKDHPLANRRLDTAVCSLKNSRMECNDAGLVTRTRAGDTDAFRVLVERHSRPLFRLAYRMTGNQQDAEDVVQDSFLRAYKQLARFDERASFGTWLYRIAVNCSLDLVRSRKRRNELAAPGGFRERRSHARSSPRTTRRRTASR